MKTQAIPMNARRMNFQPETINDNGIRDTNRFVRKVANVAMRLTATLGLAVLIIFACNESLMAQTLVLYAETPSQLSTSSANWTPITGLTITLPPLSAGFPPSAALVTLNLPYPYASGNNYPGGFFGISVNGVVLPTIAAFTTNIQAPGNTGRSPTTLVVKVNLLPTSSQTIQAVWADVRGSTVIMDTTSTLSAVIAPL